MMAHLHKKPQKFQQHHHHHHQNSSIIIIIKPASSSIFHRSRDIDKLVSFFHISNRSDSLGNFTISRFYQGHKKKATKDGTIGNATGAILRGGTAAGFRVEIAIRVRYKLIFFKTKRRQIVVEADFEFNGKGIERGGGRRERRLNEEEVGGKGD
ncbi:hypothetical protein LINPERPRIM_LOCUS13184 [Linum perenne]